MRRKWEQKWQEWGIERPFDYEFLDQRFNKFYQAEENFSELMRIFGVLAIFIACLGLFGLASFTIEQRTKEIGVRKVVGASVANIIQLISNDFIRLVVMAFLIACPIAWFAMDTWLQNFAYRIDMEWWVFLASGAIAIIIAAITVSFQSIKAAMTNPVKALKYE